MDNLNVLNTKALERQVKVLETRIAEVQSELTELDKRRRACLILMGQDIELEPAVVAAPSAESKPAPAPKSPKPKAKVSAEPDHDEAAEMPQAESASAEALDA